MQVLPREIAVLILGLALALSISGLPALLALAEDAVCKFAPVIVPGCIVF